MTSENQRMANLYEKIIDGNPSSVSRKTISPVKVKSHAKNDSIQNSPNYSTYNYQIQPITTQTKIGKNKNQHVQQRKPEGDILKNYMSQKVTQLKKQKQNSKRSPDQNSNKVKNIRKIVEEHQVSNHKEKAKKTLVNNNNDNGPSSNNKNSVQINQKRFTNSHSEIKKDGIDHKDKNRTDISVQINKKLPSLTPQLKTKNNPNDKQAVDANKQTPSSKNSFRIKKSMNNINSPSAPMDNATLAKHKKLREEFIKLNQSQKNMQKQILQTHLSTKDQIQKAKIKYRLNFNSYEKYGIKPNTLHPSQKLMESKVTKKPSKKNIQSSIKEIPQIKHKNQYSPLKAEKAQTDSIYDQIQKINNLLKNKEKSIKKSELKLEKNPYIMFLKEQPSDIQEQFDEEDEIDLPQEPLQTVSQKIMGQTYGSVMSQMKTKKWGLQQRITFQTHRQKSVQSSKITKQSISKLDKKSNAVNPILQQSQTKQAQDIGNKISVNSRLKNILFQ